MTSPRRSTFAFDLAELRLGESLNAFLLARRKEKVPLRRISIELNERTQVDVSPETIRQWCKLAEAEAAREPTPQPKPRTRRKRGES